jgi:WD repeat-containing protein 23
MKITGMQNSMGQVRCKANIFIRRQHPSDNSIVTFRGHKVLRTLIRCHFSPPGSTNSRYVYSGSEDGKVYIWNMDATLAGTVDVYEATKNSRPPYRTFHMGAWDGEDDYSHSRWKTCVRDASWHPNAPMIVGMFALTRAAA